MKKITVFILSIVIFTGCGGAVRQPTDNVGVSPPNSSNSIVVSSHSSVNQIEPGATIAPKSATKTRWAQSGDPIDTSAFDAAIAKAEKNLKVKTNDEEAKKTLAANYVNRGLALTEARQYASALGDYRRALKYDPNNQEAKKWISQIIEIYDGLNKEYPKEGEEPPPLFFKNA